MMEEKPLIAPLLPGDPLLLGGKGSGLGLLVQAGLPVPPGFVLTTAAWQLFREAHPVLTEHIAAWQRHSTGQEAALNAACAALHDLILRLELPPGIIAALEEALHNLPGDGLLAARSSAVGEDHEAQSFAGIHESAYRLHGTEQLLGGIRSCWASLFSARAASYRVRHGLLDEPPSMAVVIQRMTGMDLGGVLFSTDPVSGSHESMVVNVVRGSGEALVSGAAQPETVYLPRLGEFDHTSQLLSSTQLVELRSIALQVEQLFGGNPVDIEWGWEQQQQPDGEGRWWYYQARPVTTQAPSAKPVLGREQSPFMHLFRANEPQPPSFSAALLERIRHSVAVLHRTAPGTSPPDPLYQSYLALKRWANWATQSLPAELHHPLAFSHGGEEVWSQLPAADVSGLQDLARQREEWVRRSWVNFRYGTELHEEFRQALAVYLREKLATLPEEVHRDLEPPQPVQGAVADEVLVLPAVFYSDGEAAGERVRVLTAEQGWGLWFHPERAGAVLFLTGNEVHPVILNHAASLRPTARVLTFASEMLKGRVISLAHLQPRDGTVTLYLATKPSPANTTGATP